MFHFKNNSDLKLRKFCIKYAAGSKEPAKQAILMYRFAKGRLEPLKNVIKWDDSISDGCKFKEPVVVKFAQ